MKIKDLVPKQGNIEVVGEVVEMDPVREFSKFGKAGKVCNATIKDDSGSVKLTLWNEQTEQVEVGDTVKVTNGYVNEWQGQKQLSTGKFGKLEVVGKSESKKDINVEKPADDEDPITEDEVLEEDIVKEEEIL